MNIRTKKIVAREFIYLIGATIILLILFLGYLFLHNRNQTAHSELEKRIETTKDSLSQTQLLWAELYEKNIYTDSYSDFKSKYNDVENQKFLYQQLQNIDIYTNSLSDFRLKYFKSDLANEDIYALYKDENGWIPIEAFEELLTNPEVVERLYERFVETGYSGTYSDFQKLIFVTENPVSESEIKREYEKIQKLKEELNENNNSPFSKSIGRDQFLMLTIFICSILFLFRYIFYGVTWSIKQIRE